eukprot:TRINITY_DN5728_c0_g3_i1.p1 TRINITY_DN5728_c0_g3~~TRINITY_DN5728_c0_g3_i1.p1  ORF type:complete len:508 (+),score=177.98 TRINITY_DN5728_c0_g3_i1:98-1621(+)
MNQQTLLLSIVAIVAVFLIVLNMGSLEKEHEQLAQYRQLKADKSKLESVILRQRSEIDQLKRDKELLKRKRSEDFVPPDQRKESASEHASSETASEPASAADPAASLYPNRAGAIGTVKTEIDVAKETHLRKWLDEYTTLHNDIMQGRKPERYVHCVLINGWGNVLQEAVSCFLFALVTERAAIFNTRPVDGYMPFQQSLNPPGFLPIDIYNMKPVDKHGDGLVIPRFNLTCLDYSAIKDKVMVTVHLTYDFYAPNILINPFHGEKVLQNLPRNYFQVIFDYLFKLAPELQEEVDNFKREHFGKFTVGIQIRAPTHTHKDPQKKDHQGFPVPALDLFAQMAEQLGRFQGEAAYEDVVWFVGTQNVKLIEKLQSSYGSKKVTAYNGTITTTFDSHGQGQRVSLITFFLLSECNEVVTTEVSSYGTVAAARSGLYPIYCTHHKFCARRLLPTPCQDTHFLPDQPQDCLKQLRSKPHQFVTAVDSSCGYFKWQIYSSDEYHKDDWSTIKT